MKPTRLLIAILRQNNKKIYNSKKESNAMIIIIVDIKTMNKIIYIFFTKKLKILS